MKTRIALLITAALLAVGLPIPAHAATAFAYSVSGGNATITGYYGTPPSTLVIPDEISNGNGTYPVTAIGDFAFTNSQLTELTLPDSLTAIGNNAFYGNRLTELTFPDSLTAIGDNAFYLNQLTELTLSGALTTIGNFAFSHNQLTELALPDTLTTIGNFAFYSNKLTELTLSHALTTIGNSAFYNNRLTELAFPDTLTTIGDSAFINNPDLDDVRFTGPAPTLGTDALGTSDPTVRFPWKLGDPRATGGYTTPTWHGYETIAVAEVTFAGGGTIDAQTVDVDGTSTATKPTDPVKAGNRFTGWFTDGATTPFDFTTPIAGDITLTAGFEAPVAPVLTGSQSAAVKLGDAFEWTPTTLTGSPAPTVTARGLPDGLEIDSRTGVISGKVTDPALAGDHDVTITASNGIDPIATFDLTISIEYFTYSTADGHATITGYHGAVPADLVIPDEITDADGAYPVTAIGDNAFSYKVLTSLDLPDGLITIGDRAFISALLTDLRLPNTVTTIGYGAFTTSRLTTLELPDSLTTIGGWAFNNNRLTTLHLSDGLTTIGQGAFNINQLTTLEFPDSLTTIGDWAFADNRLATLDLPDTLTTIGAVAFYNNRLTTLDLPDSLTTIDSQAFYSNRLTTLDLPDALTTIGSQAFLNNPLTAVRFTGKAPAMGAEAFGVADPFVRFPWKFGDPQATDGYTAPLWNGYDTIAVADVTFAGGGAVAPQAVDVDGVSKATKPVDPIKAGYVFTGWFDDAAATPFDFSTPIVGDIVLTAGFEPAAVPGPGAPSPGIPVPADPAIRGLDPAIAGNAREGKALTAKPGKLSPSTATFTYQWRADGKAVKGATKPTLTLRKAQAGRRISVTITAKTTGARSVTATSAKTKPVSSAKRRLVLSTYRIEKNKPVTVTATGFKARQKVIIWLGGDNRYVGRADSRGVITKTVTFAKDTEAGNRRVRVSSYRPNGDRARTVHTTVRYR